jgi:hypothetical protein
VNSVSEEQLYRIQVAINATNTLQGKKSINPCRKFLFDYLAREDEKEKKKYERFKNTLPADEIGWRQTNFVGYKQEHSSAAFGFHQLKAASAPN